ncbi:MAG TPA: zinc ABC transporter substrate-binding protein, partial [Candidatus Acidoferrum sp.]|nr:zinc ABC transporter substrate-binding protein [Candidatus Acidoferrum sp.]
RPWLIVALAAILSACSGPAAGSPAGTNAIGTAPASVGPSTGPAVSGPPIAVLGTENFYADLLAQIGGSRVSATSLLNDPNADPHAFESSPQDAALVADARLVIVNGLGYDAFMDKLLGASNRPDRVVINVQQLLGFADDVNVHVWYDPATMPKVAAAATEALATLEPQNAAYFRAQEQAYLAELKPIGDKIASLKATYAGRPIAFTENVAGYLTDQIGLTVKTPVGFMKAVEEGTDPAPADVAAERDLFTTKAVKVLLYNSQVTSPITQQIHDLAQQSGIPIVGVAETIPPAYHTYAEWQLAQLAELEHALATGG